jgi:RNA polymerase sigma-70 factor (ECF subfamily)
MRNPRPEPPVPIGDTPPEEHGLDADTRRVLEALRPELLRFAYWLNRDRSIAEDVVQEAMLRAWRSRGALKDPAAARGWLLTIVRREHARLYERKRLETTSLHEAIATENAELAAQGDGELLGLRLAILQLPEEYRVPLIMQVLGGLTTEEIGRELDLSTAAVLTRLFRARNKLRTIYGLNPAPDDSAEPNEGSI